MKRNDIKIVTVLMCVYNGGKYLAEAVNSVLEQSFLSFEFLIINDGSSDNSAEILSTFKDPRIRILTNQQNEGLISSLNRGLKEAKGEFIARMDADDICYPERIEKQVHFFNDNLEVGLCGSWIEIIGSDEVYRYPITNDEIKASMLFCNPMAHPSVMFRRKLFADHELFYDINFPGAEDYELWTRAIFKTGFANMGDTLVKYRKHENQVTKSKQELVGHSAGKIKLGLLKNFQMQISEREKMIHLFLFNDQYKELNVRGNIQEADAWLYRIFCANNNLQIFSKTAFCDIWKTRLFVIATKQYNFNVWEILSGSYCFKFANVGIKEKIRLYVKCLVKRKVG